MDAATIFMLCILAVVLLFEFFLIFVALRHEDDGAGFLAFILGWVCVFLCIGIYERLNRVSKPAADPPAERRK